MSGSRLEKIPSYRLHRNSGQAVVTLSGRDVYLGPHGTKVSRLEYDRVVGEWLANGRMLPPDLAPADRSPAISVTELIRAYWQFAKTYYVKNGQPTSELNCIKRVLRLLRERYGHSSAASFGPLALKAVRQNMIDKGLARKSINEYVSRIKRTFKWGVSNELVPSSVFHGLMAVEGLRLGRSEARETEPVRPVPDAWVEAIRPHVSGQVWAIVELMRLTGMRIGEVVIMRGRDLDTSGAMWVYRPASHKTQHHGFDRAVYLGPRAQEVIASFMKQNLEACLFSPEEAEARRSEGRHRNRKTPLWPSHVRCQARKRPLRRNRAPQEHYTIASCRRAITRACAKAGVPHWHPHQLRHSFATKIRKEYGLEAARAMLGHHSVDVTEIYAEMDQAKANQIAARVG